MREESSFGCQTENFKMIQNNWPLVVFNIRKINCIIIGIGSLIQIKNVCVVLQFKLPLIHGSAKMKDPKVYNPICNIFIKYRKEGGFAITYPSSIPIWNFLGHLITPLPSEFYRSITCGADGPLGINPVTSHLLILEKLAMYVFDVINSWVRHFYSICLTRQTDVK